MMLAGAFRLPGSSFIVDQRVVFFICFLQVSGSANADLNVQITLA